MSFVTKSEASGEIGTKKYRIFFKDSINDKKISPWHDIPLKDGDFFNFVTEIPKFTSAKMEIVKSEVLNPIAQDIKSGQLRFYHGPIYWNYGYIPQTWENPNVEHSVMKCFGDNDPIDVVEIGSDIISIGEVRKVKVLGVFAMIDSGELDWKVVAIASDDAMAAKLNDIEDVEKYLPGVISGIREWFRWYKTPDGKPLNKFGYDEECLGREKAIDIIQETHLYWNELMSGKIESGNLWKK
jgi:inorganic pyrophosphatase